ncbi:MAG: MbnP family protein [Saprospiraceae bacterium]
MKKLLAFTLFASFLFFQYSCKPDPTLEATTDVELIFKGKYADEVLMINQDYEYDGNPIRFDQFNFYISNVVLVKEIVGNPEETELLEINFVDLSFKPADIDDATKGFVITAPNIPVGEYSGIKINLGVASDLNKTGPEDYGSGHPLRNAGHYWTAWNSFIFSKTEAKIDVDSDGTFSHKLAYHTGSDDAYRSRFFAKDISLVEDATSKVSFTVDAKMMFEDIDVMTETGTHNINDMDLVNEIMDNLQEKCLAIE